MKVEAFPLILENSNILTHNPESLGKNGQPLYPSLHRIPSEKVVMKNEAAHWEITMLSPPTHPGNLSRNDSRNLFNRLK